MPSTGWPTPCADFSQFDFPVGLNPVTRGFFERVAATEDAADGGRDQGAARRQHRRRRRSCRSPTRPDYNAVIRTTCVATLLEAGHAENALPQTARATVNCRDPAGSAGRRGRTHARRASSTIDKVKITPEGQGGAEPAVADQSRGDARSRNARRRDVARRSGHPDHVAAATPTAAGCATPASRPTASPACSPIPATAACTGSTSRSA